MKPELTTLSNFREILAFMNLPVFAYLDSDDFAIIKLHDMGLKMPYLTPTYRPDYYALTFIKEGKGKFVLGDKVFELGANHVFLKFPDIYFSSGWTEAPVGYSISLSKKFLSENLSVGMDGIPINKRNNGLNFGLSQDDFTVFEQICLEIYDEAISNAECKYEIISNLVNNLLLLIQQQLNKIKLEIENEKSNLIISSFHKNIDKNLNMMMSGESSIILRAKEHAQMLNLSENYLSKVISKTSGKSINQWINVRLIDEITYLLKNSEKSMSEIAALFGFDDLNYFYSFFKKHAKATATSVRNDFNKSDSDRAHVYRGDIVNIRRSW